MAGIAQLERAGRVLQSCDACCAHALMAARVQRPGVQLTLDHVREAGHREVAARGAGAQDGQIFQSDLRRVEAAVDCRGRHRRGGVLGRAVFGDRVVARLDAVLREDAPLDARRGGAERRDVAVEIVVADRLAGQNRPVELTNTESKWTGMALTCCG